MYTLNCNFRGQNYAAIELLPSLGSGVCAGCTVAESLEHGLCPATSPPKKSHVLYF